MILGTGAALLLSRIVSVSSATALLIVSPGGILLCHALGWYVGERVTSRSLSRRLLSGDLSYWPPAMLHGGIGWTLWLTIFWFA